jgi:hypothetical protein
MVFRQIAVEQPVNEDTRQRERVDFANYVKGNWPTVVELLSARYDLVQDEPPLNDVL